MTATEAVTTAKSPTGAVRRSEARRRRRLEGPKPVVAVLQALLFVLYGVPVVWIVLTSFKSDVDVDNPAHIFLFTPTLHAYQDALASGGLVTAGLQSTLIAAGTTVLTILIAAPAAYGIARLRGRTARWSLTILIMLQMIPQTSMVIPLFQIFGNVGLLDKTIGVILADSALLAPWATLLMRPFFRAVPIALEEAAAIDGASSFRIFRSVVLPGAANGILTTATLVFMISWGEFLYAVNFLLSPGKYPLSASLVAAVGLYTTDWPGLMALAVVTSVPILILFAATYRLLREGLMVGAVK